MRHRCPMVSGPFVPGVGPLLPFALLSALLISAGCRTLSCNKQSDETIAMTRQLSLQGKAAQQKGEWEKAEACFADAVQRSPADERARCGYAESLWRRGSQEQAVAHMVEAVKLSGNDPERLVQLGQMHLAQNNLPAAMRQADKAIAANKQLASAWCLRASVQRVNGQQEESLAAYHRALSLQPHYPEAQVAVAELYNSSQRPQRALATLQSLADQYPPGSVPPDVLCRQGIVLKQLGRHQDAADCLAAAARGQPSADLWFEIAQARLQIGDLGNATAAVNHALHLDPRHVPARELQQRLAANQGNMTAALHSPPNVR